MLSIEAKEYVIVAKNAFKKEFVSGFDNIRILLMFTKNELTEEQINSVLNILSHALSKSELKLEESEWIEKYYAYFRGNCVVIKQWIEKFENKNYGFSDLPSFLDMIRIEKDYDFAIRNIITTLRDDVNFIEDQDALAELYISVLNDLLK